MKQFFDFQNLIRISVVFLVFFVSFQSISQTYITRNGEVRFFSAAPLENIEAINRQVSSAFDSETGEIVFRVVIRSFKFEKALMQEHFNDNFMDSKKYPNATFEGKIQNLNKINFKSDGVYDVICDGKLTIKDVTKDVVVMGKITIKGNSISGSSQFKIVLADYNVQVPSRYMRNIANNVDVFVNVTLEKR